MTKDFRRLLYRRILPLTGLAIELVIIVVLVARLPQPVPEVVSGSVQCASGLPVVGIWLEAQRGGSSWSDFRLEPDVPSQAQYHHELPNGGPYELRVGCGGNLARWQSTSYTGFVRGTGHRFVCDDRPTTGEDGRCRR